jgi:HEAT repeat protein
VTDRPARLGVSSTERQRLEEIDRLYASGPASVPEFVLRLDDPSWLVRRQVVGALATLGDAAVPELCRLLVARRDDENVLAAAVDSLVASTGNVDGPLDALMEDSRPAVLCDVAQVLGRRRAPASVAALVRLLSHADDNVAVAATEALGRIGGRAAVDALVLAVRSGKFFRVYPAIDVLGRSGDPRAVAPLAELLEDARYSQEAIRALGRTGERGAIPPLARLLASPVDVTVRTAALALRDLHERHRERFGVVAGLEDALCQAVMGQMATQPVVRRLVHSLAEGDAAEQRAVCLLLGLLGNDAAIPALTRLLDSPVAAPVAAEALRRIGQQDSEGQLRRALREGDSSRRQVLLPTLVASSSVEDIALCLVDPDAAVRALSCDALGRIGNPRVVPVLFRCLGDTNPRVVQAAIAAIQSLGSAEIEPLALGAASSPQPGTRRAALRILSYFGFPAALQTFLDARRDEDERVRDTALQGLPFLEDPAAHGALLEAARDAAPRTRASAARALGQCAADERTVDVLLQGTVDADAWVRYFSIQSLGKLRVERTAETIAALLHDAAGQVRVAAVEALAHLSGDVAHEALRAAGASSEADVHRAALIGLGLGRRSDSFPILVEALRSTDAVTRLVALSAVAGFGTPAALQPIARAARDHDEGIRTAAIGFLAGWAGIEATEVLVDLLRDAQVRDKALTALATPTPERATALVTLLGEADDELCPLLTGTLSRLDRHDPTGTLLPLLSSINIAARKAAASTLAALGTREALSGLRSAARDDSSPEVRQICSLLLAG